MKLRIHSNGSATKTGDGEVLAIEAEKSRLGAAIGKSTGLFYVPEVISCRPEQGMLHVEWINNLESLTSIALSADPQMPELCRRAGAALSAIHEQLRLPEPMRLPLPEPGRSASGTGVFLHGDFNGDNVCYERRRDRLVVVDWSSAPLFGGKPTWGSRYFDLMWFGHFFFCSRPARWLGIWQDNAWYEALISEYRAQAGPGFSAKEFAQYRGAAEPLFSAARKQMLGSVHRTRRAVRAWVLWRAKVRWQRWAFPELSGEVEMSGKQAPK